MSYLKTQGIVIKEVSTGESDKVITILSKSSGRISAFAKGSKRPKSNLAAGTQIMSYCEFVLFCGRKTYSVNSCDVIESFYGIRNDIIRLTYAAHLMDITYDIIRENQPSPKTMQLLLNSFHLLSKTERPPELIARIFELKSLAIAGYAPHVKSCMICGNEDAEGCAFSFEKCGIICGREACSKAGSRTMPLSAGAVKAVRHIVYSGMSSLFSFNLSKDVLKELNVLNSRYLRDMLEHTYTKLDFLKNLQ